MREREMLELAAKAAGIKLLGWSEISFGYKLEQPMAYWNPLADDGDALRLAVKLELIVDTHGSHVQVSYPFDTPLAFEKIVDDPCAATRLAITRAAAEIGKAMRASQ